ncbi:MAG: TIGR03032 family protein [Magnetococcales bacterium]|nr:TIGR03032 family protein [Magnetococcales bacterium]
MAEQTEEKKDTQVRISASDGFIEFLKKHNIGLTWTARRSNRLFFAGVTPEDGLHLLDRHYPVCAGLCAKGNQIHVNSKSEMWTLRNVLEQGEYRGFDRVFVPRIAYMTGDVQAHEMDLDADGRLIFVNTRFSCLATTADLHSFQPLWKPPFISELRPEDRCHLNGLAMKKGQPRYVTAVSTSDTAQGWREHRGDGGCIMDIRTGEFVIKGLSMPHSPRLYKGKFYVLNSGTGHFGEVDIKANKFTPITFCPGFARGMKFIGDHALVAVSKPRTTKAFEGLDLDDALIAYSQKPLCGVLLINLKKGKIVERVTIDGLIDEIQDLAILENCQRPYAISPADKTMATTIHIDNKVAHSVPSTWS